jgi:hypothetical protein
MFAVGLQMELCEIPVISLHRQGSHFRSNLGRKVVLPRSGQLHALKLISNSNATEKGPRRLPRPFVGF